MDRRLFLTLPASFAAGLTLSQKADALEQAASAALDKQVGVPWMCDVGAAGERIQRNAPDELGISQDTRPYLMHDEPRLPPLPKAPTLMDFFTLRFAPASHLLQSANVALKNGHSEKVVMACLLHDIGLSALLRTDHGYWGAQLVEPYVDEEVAWAIRAHQALRFFPDPSVGYEYPKAYIRLFGADYRPEPYVVADYERARKHKWYMSARLVTVSDLYAFDPKSVVPLDRFTDIIGRNFRQPREGLGFDGSPVAHMWRSIIWPNNFL
jgi:hypothetical protein